jgi:hypothetical protein
LIHNSNNISTTIVTINITIIDTVIVFNPNNTKTTNYNTYINILWNNTFINLSILYLKYILPTHFIKLIIIKLIIALEPIHFIIIIEFNILQQ